MKYALSCIASAVLLLAAELPQAPAQTSVAFATIARGAHSAILDPTELAIRTASEWATLWRRHTLGIPEARTAPPAVDFFREMVVAVFAGQVPAGTHLTILKIFPQGNRLIVESQLRGPARRTGTRRCASCDSVPHRPASTFTIARGLHHDQDRGPRLAIPSAQDRRGYSLFPCCRRLVGRALVLRRASAQPTPAPVADRRRSPSCASWY